MLSSRPVLLPPLVVVPMNSYYLYGLIAVEEIASIYFVNKPLAVYVIQRVGQTKQWRIYRRAQALSGTNKESRVTECTGGARGMRAWGAAVLCRSERKRSNCGVPRHVETDLLWTD